MDPGISWMELCEGVHDPRRAPGQRHPLPTLLSLAVVGLLAGMTRSEAIVECGTARGWEVLRLLGGTRRRGLCKATYARAFRRIDVADVEARIGRWLQGRLAWGAAPHIAIDGKTARGRRDGQTPGVPLVSAYAPRFLAVVGQLRVDAKTNESKAALEVRGVLPIKGSVVTGDALGTHRDVGAKVGARGGDSVLPVRDNQPQLRADINIRAAFAAPQPGLSPPADRPPCRAHGPSL